MSISLVDHIPILKSAIKLVYFDIDGTLLTTQGSYTSLLQQHIQRIQSLGVKTAIASGRPSYAAQFLFDELSIMDVGVFCTGAEIFNPRENKHLAIHNIEPILAHRLYSRAKVLGLYCELYTPSFHCVDIESDISRVHGNHLRVLPRIISGEAVFNNELPIVKFLLGRDRNTHATALQQIEHEFPELDFAYAHFLARPTWEFASVISQKADKKKAFENLLDVYQLSAEQVMAIGDSQSDITFIQAAGVGIAMGNASEEIKHLADYVTKTNDRNGVAFALEKLIHG